MTMQPPDWWEFSLDVYPDWDKNEWVAVATWGPHPDGMVSHTWYHHKLEVVVRIASTFLAARAADVTKNKRKRMDDQYSVNPDQLDLF